MYYIELDEDGVSLQDIIRFAKHISEDRYLVAHLSQQQADDLSAILQPTLSPDQHIDSSSQHWQHFIDSFYIDDKKGRHLHFYHDTANKKLYFGDDEGIKTAKLLDDHATAYPSETYHSASKDRQG